MLLCSFLFVSLCYCMFLQFLLCSRRFVSCVFIYVLIVSSVRVVYVRSVSFPFVACMFVFLQFPFRVSYSLLVL